MVFVAVLVISKSAWFWNICW